MPVFAREVQKSVSKGFTFGFVQCLSPEQLSLYCDFLSKPDLRSNGGWLPAAEDPSHLLILI